MQDPRRKFEFPLAVITRLQTGVIGLRSTKPDAYVCQKAGCRQTDRTLLLELATVGYLLSLSVLRYTTLFMVIGISKRYEECSTCTALCVRQFVDART